MANRTLTITIVNNTDQSLTLKSKDLSHGYWEPAPSNNLDMSIQESPVAKNHAGTDIGVTGVINYVGSSTQGAFSISFNKPWSQNPTTIQVSCPKDYTYKIDGDGSGHYGSYTITYSK